MDLISQDTISRAEAVKYTELFFEHMFSAYSSQKSHFPACDKETTYVSYPAKWPEELRGTMVEIAKNAGFHNVHGLDEPTAAIHTVMVQESGKLVLRGNDEAFMLMIDMGAGTTDLVLCRYSPFEEPPLQVLSTWPQADSPYLFGGREIDAALCEYIKNYLSDCGLPNNKNFEQKYSDKCKKWKEANLSPIFNDKDGVVRYCGFIDTLLDMLDVDSDFPPLSRTDFEDLLSDYLSQLPKLVTDCLANASFDPTQLDYVVLTGGHSQWYFARDILNGTLTRFGSLSLPRIQADNSRIIRLARPQETVALGLVYQNIRIKQKERPSIKVTGIINIIADRFSKKTGCDLFSDSAAFMRLEDAAAKAALELSSAQSATISLPYISASANGPLHVNETITREELDAFTTRYTSQATVPDTESPHSDTTTKICPQCLRPIPYNATFCGYCGNRSVGPTPQPRPVQPIQPPVQSTVFCRFCGGKISAGSAFCGHCGKPQVSAQNSPHIQSILTVSRESQFLNAAVYYDVVVDGHNYGNLVIGKSISVPINSPIVTVDILCTTFMMTGHKVKLKLKVGKAPRVNFKTEYGGRIIPSVFGADIMEQH